MKKQDRNHPNHQRIHIFSQVSKLYDNSSVLLPANMERFQEQELLVKVKKLEVHKCDRCPKVFHELTNLIKHLTYHDECFLSHVISAYVNIERAKVFNCDRCPQSFCTKRDFKLHKVQHILKSVRKERIDKRLKLINDNIIKPHKCPDCDYEFVAKSTLDKHSIVHMPFPHICDCGIGYYKWNDLIMHKKLVHGSEVATEPKIKSVSPQKKQVISERKIKPGKGPTLKAILIKKEKPAPRRWKIKLKNRVERNPNIQWNVSNPDIDIIKTPDNRFQCPGCNKTLASKAGLYTHYRIHTGERPFSCKECGKCFNQSAALYTHMTRHTTEKNYVCQYCPKAFATPDNRARHEMIHGDVKPYECPFCGKGFHDPSALIRHKRTHTGDKRYLCPYCPKAFCDISGLRRHVLMHQNKRDFECEICKKKFYTTHDLRKHLGAHNSERNFCCEYCKQYYSSKGNLVIHIRRHLSSEMKYQCEYCKRKFFLKANLKNHILRMHNKTKQYVCEHCNKLCFSMITLNEHQKRHNNNIIFKCNDCPKKFKRKTELVRHCLKNHTGLRCDKCAQYFSCQSLLKEHWLKESEQCEICDKEFFCMNLKEKHITKVHINKNIKKYECDECGLIFNHRVSLVRHLPRHKK